MSHMTSTIGIQGIDTLMTSIDALQPRRPPKVPHLWPPKLLHPGHGDLTH
uniref:Uncharacterized protein n=1 Tax=Variovorax paradoxus (strain S110) TaxID=543728 RepID=C5CLE2_VARPS